MKFTVITAFIFLAAMSASAQNGIRNVDFKNFTYEAYCAGDEAEKITVKNGEFSQEKQMDGYIDRLWFRAFDFSFGDLDGDNQEEGVVLSVCNTGGTGNFSEGYVFKMLAGKPSLVGRIGGGDRAYGGLKSARIVDGFAVIERFNPGENGASCCAEFILTEKYKLQSGKMIEFGKAVKTELYPKERIVFDKGTSGKTLKIKIPGGERKRFVVGAKAGQRLTVSAGAAGAEIRLLEDARVTEGVNNFLAVLPKTGDYTIEILNSTDAEIEVTLNVKIN